MRGPSRRACARRRGRPLPVWQGCRTLRRGRAAAAQSRPCRQPGRPLFRPAAGLRRHRPRDAAHLRAPAASPSNRRSQKEIGHADEVFEPPPTAIRAHPAVRHQRASCLSRSIRATPRRRPTSASTSTTRTAPSRRRLETRRRTRRRLHRAGDRQSALFAAVPAGAVPRRRRWADVRLSWNRPPAARRPELIGAPPSSLVRGASSLRPARSQAGRRAQAGQGGHRPALRAHPCPREHAAGWRRAESDGGASPSCAPGPLRARDGESPRACHRQRAQRFGIPEAWIWAVMRVESNGDSRAISTAGAMGLMQIMPATWAGLRARYGLGPIPSTCATTSWRARPICARCTTATATRRRCWRPIMPGRAAMTSTCRAARPLPAETRAYLATSGVDHRRRGDVQLAAAPPSDPFAWRRAALFVRVATCRRRASPARSPVAGLSWPNRQPSRRPTGRAVDYAAAASAA